MEICQPHRIHDYIFIARHQGVCNIPHAASVRCSCSDGSPTLGWIARDLYPCQDQGEVDHRHGCLPPMQQPWRGAQQLQHWLRPTSQWAVPSSTNPSVGFHNVCSARATSQPEVSKISLPSNLTTSCFVILRQQRTLKTPSTCIITLNIRTPECSGLVTHTLRNHCSDVNLVTIAFATKKRGGV